MCRLVAAWAATLSLLALPLRPVLADIIVYQSPGPVQPHELVLFNKGTDTGTTVSGFTQKSGIRVDFQSSIELIAKGGQSRVTGLGGAAFGDLTILGAGGNGFTQMELNLDAVANGQVQLAFAGLNVNQSPLTFDLGKKGQNYLGAIATSNEILTTITLTALQGGKEADIINQAGQVRVSGGRDAQPASSSLPSPIPEPTSILLFGAALGAAGGYYWLRRKSVGPAQGRRAGS